MELKVFFIWVLKRIGIMWRESYVGTLNNLMECPLNLYREEDLTEFKLTAKFFFWIDCIFKKGLQHKNQSNLHSCWRGSRGSISPSPGD